MTFDAGAYTAKTYIAYFPLGPQFVVSASYCYHILSWMMFGPTIGIALERQVPVAAASAITDLHGGWITLSPPLFGPRITQGAFVDPGYPGTEEDPANKMIIVGNFGGSIKIALSGTAHPALLILDYGTQTGAGLGVAIPF